VNSLLPAGTRTKPLRLHLYTCSGRNNHRQLRSASYPRKRKPTPNRFDSATRRTEYKTDPTPHRRLTSRRYNTCIYSCYKANLFRYPGNTRRHTRRILYNRRGQTGRRSRRIQSVELQPARSDLRQGLLAALRRLMRIILKWRDQLMCRTRSLSYHRNSNGINLRLSPISYTHFRIVHPNRRHRSRLSGLLRANFSRFRN